MKVKIKLQDKKKRDVKNKGMHLLNSFIPLQETVEVELKKSEEFILKSDEFKTWFEIVGSVKAEVELPKQKEVKKKEEKPSIKKRLKKIIE